jgi:ubiquinone/menaquinone biosynthesis C-methylase UbiE
MTNEIDAIRERYDRRAHALSTPRYEMLSPSVFQSVFERQRATLRLFSRLGIRDLASLNLIEVGAGTGGDLLELVRMGFSPDRLIGIELLPERAEKARRRLPSALKFFTGDASEYAAPAASADIVYQVGVFSSLLDDEFQEKMARVMWNWVRPGGGVLWYDFAFDNPRNPDVRGVTIRRVRQLFPDATLWWRRLTLAPPLSRLVTAVHPALYPVVNVIPLLRTHRLCWIGKS